MKIAKKIKGLSLIEILIVVFIIGILSLFITPPIITQLKKARDGKRKVDINLIQKGLEEYYDSTNCYPERLPECAKPLIIGVTNICQLENKFVHENSIKLCIDGKKKLFLFTPVFKPVTFTFNDKCMTVMNESINNSAG